MSKLAIQHLHEWSSPTEVQAFAKAELADFFQHYVNPGSCERDEDCAVIPAPIFAQAAKIGLLNYIIPRDGGGIGGTRRIFGMLLDQIGYHCDDFAFPSMLAMFADVPNVIYNARRPELVARYVRPMAQGQIFGTFAYTDYGDAFDFQTRVVRKRGRYVLSGIKCLQTGGQLADVFITYARDESDDLKILLIEKSDPGVSTTPVKTLGLRSAGLTQLKLRDVEVDESRLLNTNDGLAEAQIFLNSRRMFVVCPFIGSMRRILDLCVRHLGDVIREGRPLTQAQSVQGRLGSMAAKQITSATILQNALDRIGRNEINQMFDPVISAAKYTITENALDVANQAIRLTGWRGYSKELPFERLYRGFMAALTGQTAQDVLKINLGVVTIADVELADQRKGLQ